MLDLAFTGYFDMEGTTVQTAWTAGLFKAALDELANEGCDLLHKKQYGEAVPLLRQYLEIWKRHATILDGIGPKIWHPCNVEVLLGRSLIGLKNYDEGEPMLLGGMLEMWRQKQAFTVPGSPFARDYQQVMDQLAAYYQERGMPQKAAAWRDRYRVNFHEPKELAQVGEARARAGDRLNSAYFFLRALCLQPAEHKHWYSAAVMLAAAGMEDGYRSHCREMLQRFKNTTDAGIARRTATACLHLPASAEEAQLAASLAQRALLQSGSVAQRPHFELCMALAEYRQGHFDEADQRMAGIVSGKTNNWSLLIPARMVQAMARLQAKPGEQTRAALEQVVKDAPGMIPSGSEGADWLDALSCSCFIKEAKKLLETLPKKK
jgi:hypothetical protein